MLSIVLNSFLHFYYCYYYACYEEEYSHITKENKLQFPYFVPKPCV